MDGLLVWLTTTSISIINLERAMWKWMPCLGLIGRKMARHFELIPFRLLLLLHSHRARDVITLKLFLEVLKPLSLFISSFHDNAQVVCKSITTSEIKSDSDSSSCPDPSCNLKGMTMSDWVKVQS